MRGGGKALTREKPGTCEGFGVGDFGEVTGRVVWVVFGFFSCLSHELTS